MCALFMDFPGDPNVPAIGDEYLSGPALVVASVTDQGATSRTVCLPSGADWYNYWTNERYKGGQTITASAPIDTVPLFVRAGSIHSTRQADSNHGAEAVSGKDQGLPRR